MKPTENSHTAIPGDKARLRTKIVAVPVAIGLFFLLTTTTNWIQMGVIQGDLRDISSVLSPQSRFASELVQNTLERRLAIQQYRQTADEKYIDQLHALNVSRDQLFNEALSAPASKETRSLLSELTELDIEHLSVFQSMVVPKTRQAVEASTAIVEVHGPNLERILTNISVTAQREGAPTAAMIALGATKHVPRFIDRTGRFISTGDATDADFATMQLRALRNSIEELNAVVTTPRRRQWLEEAAGELRRTRELLSQVVSAVLARNAAVQAELAPLEDAIMGHAAVLQDGARDTLESSIVAATESIRASIVVFLGLAAVALVGIIYLAGRLRRAYEWHDSEQRVAARMENKIAHASGMAEVATGVLHNVGNVINSVNISADLAQNGLRTSSIGILENVIGLLDSHGADSATLQKFLTADPRGKRMVESLNVITKRLQQEHAEVDEELASLREHVRHVIAIVASQQEYARSMGVLEELDLGPFLDKAIALSGTAFSSNDICVERSYGDAVGLTIEPHKLMQIVVNLLSNARHALAENDPGDRVIRVQTRSDGDDSVVISVADNGTGIPEENLTRIFAHGFTTKANGHGFGLHSSATAAMELGGKLSAETGGLGLGATFLLTLPARPAEAA